jgi:hypothetical protein
LLWGSLAGSPAGLFTKFHDWPIELSTVYRTSGIAYGLTALGAVLDFAGCKNLGKFYRNGQILGLDKLTWTKIGAFIQGSSYFVNLMLKEKMSEDCALALNNKHKTQ